MSDVNFDYSSLGFDVEFSEEEKRKIREIKARPREERISQKGLDVTPTSGNVKGKDQWMKDLFDDILRDVRYLWR